MGPYALEELSFSAASSLQRLCRKPKARGKGLGVSSCLLLEQSVPGIRDSGLLSLKKVGALTVGDTGDLGRGWRGVLDSRQDFQGSSWARLMGSQGILLEVWGLLSHRPYSKAVLRKT